MNIDIVQYPSTCACPECGGELGINPSNGPMDSEGYASREVYCYECSFHIIEDLGPCGQRWD